MNFPFKTLFCWLSFFLNGKKSIFAIGHKKLSQGRREKAFCRKCQHYKTFWWFPKFLHKHFFRLPELLELFTNVLRTSWTTPFPFVSKALFTPLFKKILPLIKNAPFLIIIFISFHLLNATHFCINTCAFDLIYQYWTGPFVSYSIESYSH